MKANLYELGQDLKHPYQRALLLIAAIPLFPEYISFFLVIAAAVFALQDLRQNPREIRIGFIGKALLAYAGYMTLSCIYSSNRLQSAAIAIMWWFFFVVYLIVANLLTDTDRVDGFLLCITAVAGIVGLIACIQYRLNFFLESNTGSTWDWLDQIVFRHIPFKFTQLDYYLRAYSTFPNPNMLAQYLVMVAPFVACFNFIERRESLRMFSRICLFLTFAGILFSFSRGGYIALIVLAMGLILLNLRHRFAAVSLYVISAILFLPEEVINRLFSIRGGITSSGIIADGVIDSIGGSITTSEIINNSGAEFAVGDRWRMWFESITCFLERPLFGYSAGTDTTWALFEQAGLSFPHAHNIVLQILLEGGIIALAIMALLGFKTVKNAIELMRNGYSASFWVGFAILSFAVCFLLHGMVDYPLTTPRLVCCFITILGIAEQSVRVFTARGISVRRHIRSRLKKRKSA